MALSRHQTILAVAAEQEKEWLELLRTIVDIDSGPDDHAGISQVYTVLARVLEELGSGSRRFRRLAPMSWLPAALASTRGVPGWR